MVDARAKGSPAGASTGDLSGQRPAQCGDADAVLEAAGGVRGLVRTAATAGLLSALSEQVQPDRALLVQSGAEVGRGLVKLSAGDITIRPAHALVREKADGEASDRRLPGRAAPDQERDETLRGPLGAFQDVAQVRHHDTAIPTKRRVNKNLPLVMSYLGNVLERSKRAS